MTFGTAAGQEKRFAPRKGRQTLNALMAELGDVEPSPMFSDYLERRRRRDAPAAQARADRAHHQLPRGGLRRARWPPCVCCARRHVVVVANLREQIVGAIAAQPLSQPESVFEVAAALDYEQRRRDMLRRLAGGGAVLIDCEPRALGVELVKRYTVLKRTGAI